MSKKYSVKPRKVDLQKTRQDLLNALVEGNQLTSIRLLDNAIALRWEPSIVYVNVIAHCLAEIGSRWHSGELTIATEHRATQLALRLLARAQDTYATSRRVGRRAVITSVEGDNHIIGGLTFADLLRFEGWHVDFLGADSPVDSVVDIVEREAPDLVGLSVTIEEYLPNAAKTVSDLNRLHPNPVIVVGGAAAGTPSAMKALIEADFIGADAVEAVNWTQQKFNLDESSVSLEVMLSDLGSKIQALRKDRGMNQQRLAAEAGLDRSYVSAIEHGKQNVSFATLKGISDALGVEIGELISD
jgi:methanogenic corrinoid protein MtbC1/DNA-binding Xre family transcriptional regulator